DRGFRAEHGQPYSHHRASAEFTLHFDFAAMQIDTALHNHQTEACTRTISDVLPTMESAKEPLPVGFRNADPLVVDGANDLCSGRIDFEANRPARVRILDSVRQEICENVLQQALVGMDLVRHFG